MMPRLTGPRQRGTSEAKAPAIAVQVRSGFVAPCNRFCAADIRNGMADRFTGGMLGFRGASCDCAAGKITIETDESQHGLRTFVNHVVQQTFERDSTNKVGGACRVRAIRRGFAIRIGLASRQKHVQKILGHIRPV